MKHNKDITYEELDAWLEAQRQAFYLGCRVDPHSLQVNEFVNGLRYYMEKDFGYKSKYSKKDKT